MGRVTAVYEGSDGLVRVVDITNGKNTYRRPIHKLVKLLGHESNSSPRWGGGGGGGCSGHRGLLNQLYLCFHYYCFVFIYSCITLSSPVLVDVLSFVNVCHVYCCLSDLFFVFYSFLSIQYCDSAPLI